MGKIFVCGEALIDFVPESEGSKAYVPFPGGSPFNAAKAAAQAGADVAFLGGISTDLFGDQMVADLQAHDVDTSLTPRSDDPSTLAFVDFATGDPRYAFFNIGTTTANMAPDAEALTPEAGDILDVGSISLIDLPGADNITRFAVEMSSRMMLAFDPNARPSMIHDRAAWDARMEALMAASSILKISAEDMDYMEPGVTAADFAAARLAEGCAMVVVTDGGTGATAFTGAETVQAVTPTVEVEDTVGAGDTFMGNMLAWLTRNDVASKADLAALTSGQLGEMLAVAMTAAAINCTRKGCNPPKLQETTDWMQARA